MKYLIHVAWELDGHAGSEVMFAKTSDEAYNKIIDAISEVNQDTGIKEQMGEIFHTNTSKDGHLFLYGKYDEMGFSAHIVEFKKYSQLSEMELFTRTG